MLRNRFENCGRHCFVDTYSADSDTAECSDAAFVATAVTAMRTAGPHAVVDSHHAPPPATSRQASQQCPPTTSRSTGSPLLHVRVLGNHPLMLLELIPRDIPRVMVAQQDAPVL